MKHYIFLLFLFLTLGSTSVQAQLIAVKSDVLLDCALTPNFGAELVTGEKTSLGATCFMNKNPWGQKMRMAGVMPEFRYWFNGRPMRREFVGLAVLGVNYDITWDEEIYNGDAIGLGVTFGYSFYLARHWALECYGSVGAVYYKQQHGYTKDFYPEIKEPVSGYALVPFKLGVSISYIIK